MKRGEIHRDCSRLMYDPDAVAVINWIFQQPPPEDWQGSDLEWAAAEMPLTELPGASTFDLVFDGPRKLRDRFNAAVERIREYETR